MHVPSTLLLPNVVSLFSVSFHDLSPSRCVFYYVVYFPPVSHSTCLSPAAFSSCNDSFLISYCPSFCVSFSCRVSCTAFPIWSTLQYCNNSTTLQTHFLPNGLEKNFLMKPLSVSSWPVSYLSPCVSPLDNGSTQLVCVEGGGKLELTSSPPHSHLPPQPSSHPPPPPLTIWLCVGVQWFSQSNETHHQRKGPTFIVKIPHLSLHKFQTSAVS